MIQVVGHRRAISTSRGAAAVLLAVLLNLALVPCTMAFEVVEEGHDCCPPKLNLEPQECCDLDDASVDSRSGVQKHDVTPDVDSPAAGIPAVPTAFSPARFLTSSDPPDPPGPPVALYKKHCVFLK